MANRVGTRKTLKCPFIEYRSDEPRVFQYRDGILIRHSHARRLLAAVLERKDAIEGQVRDPFSRSPDSKDAAGFFQHGSDL